MQRPPDQPDTIRPRRRRCARRADRNARALPRGLSAQERAWVLERCAQAGGLAAAFRRLVQLAVLQDALTATSLARARLVRRARRQGLPEDEIERRLRAWTDSRASSALGARLLNLAGWRRPEAHGGYGRAPDDDPAQPLPRATMRRLIAEGRAQFGQWLGGARAAADGRGTRQRA